MRVKFQSTQPEWAATTFSARPSSTISYFNPRSPSGLRRFAEAFTAYLKDFNPRSPSGLRPELQERVHALEIFQSTQPEWAATKTWYRLFLYIIYFNPRSPSGLRRKQAALMKRCFIFQSTQPEWAATKPPAVFRVPRQFQSTQPEWAATVSSAASRSPVDISIHAARVGCDT